MSNTPNRIRPSAADTNAVKPVNPTVGVQRKPRSAVRERKVTRLVGQVDRPFLILVIILVCIGSVMVFSTSYTYAELKGFDSFYFARRQGAFVVIGLIIMALVSKFGEYRWLKRFTLTIFMVALAINVATAIPGIGLERNGARRWLNIGIDFQPSEVLKFALILMCAKQASDSKGEMNNFKKGILPFLIILGMSAVTAS